MTKMRDSGEQINIDCAVAFFVFNRPEESTIVFEQIRKARPRTLLIIADGPRPTVGSDAEACSRVRKLIEERIDWDCKVMTNYSERNLGCKVRISSGLDWVFNLVDRAIILEDDCVPAQSFFPYCNELLSRFAKDTRVMQICGTNVSPETTNQEYSYYFSRFGPIWGWASWKRAWESYDVAMKAWPEIVEKKIYKNFWEFPGEAEYRLEIYDRVFRGEVDTWDLQWGFAKFMNSGFSIIPCRNLISNIGYGENATHTKSAESPVASMKTNDLEFPLKHYPYIIRNKEVDWAFHTKMTPPNYRPNL